MEKLIENLNKIAKKPHELNENRLKPVLNSTTKTDMSFEVFFHALKNDLKRHFHAAVACVHHTFDSFHFSCIHCDKNFKQIDLKSINPTSSHMLPQGWNTDDKNVCLHYYNCEKGIHFAVQLIDFKKYALVHMMRSDGESLTHLDVPYEENFGDLSNFNDAFKDCKKLLNSIETNLLEPILHNPRPMFFKSEFKKKSEITF